MRRRQAAQPMLLLFALTAGCISWFAPEPRPRLRLVTWNIHHARGIDDRVDVGRIADQLRPLKPDVVCLQEVDVGVERSGRVDIPAALAQLLQLHAAFGKNIDYQGGDYGNAILTRGAITWQRNLHYSMLRDGEQRGLLMVEVDGHLTFGCTHLDYRADDAERYANSFQIREAQRQHTLAAVAGDFNDRPGSRTHRELGTALLDCWEAVGRGPGSTFPSTEPAGRIDWVLARRCGNLLPVAARVLDTDASDHCLVVVDFDIVGPNDPEFRPPHPRYSY